MFLPSHESGAHTVAAEIFPTPVVSRFWGGARAVKQVEAKRHAAERVIDAHCADCRLALMALETLSNEERRLAISGRSVPHESLVVVAEFEKALGVQ
jgi:hypothetical protein